MSLALTVPGEQGPRNAVCVTAAAAAETCPDQPPLAPACGSRSSGISWCDGRGRMEMRNAGVRACISQSSFAGGEKETSQLHVSSGNCPLGSLSPPAGWLLGHVGFVSRKRSAGFGGLTWFGVA